MLFVELLELGRDVCEGLALDASSRLLRQSLTERRVLREAGERRGRELRLLVDSRRRRDRRAGGCGLERHAGEALERRDEDRRLVEERGPARTVAARAHARAAAQPGRDRRASRERLRPQEDELPVGKLAERAQDGP